MVFGKVLVKAKEGWVRGAELKGAERQERCPGLCTVA
jgi:hypothetical protein